MHEQPVQRGSARVVSAWVGESSCGGELCWFTFHSAHGVFPWASTLTLLSHAVLQVCTDSTELLTMSSRASLAMGQHEQVPCRSPAPQVAMLITRIARAQVIVDTGRLIKLDRSNIPALALRAQAYYQAYSSHPAVCEQDSCGVLETTYRVTRLPVKAEILGRNITCDPGGTWIAPAV